MPRRFLLAWSAFALAFSLQIGGCSLAGYYAGRALDESWPVRLHRGAPAAVVRLVPGATLAVRFHDGSRVAGRYLGIDSRPDPGYVARYAAWRDTASPGFHPPRIGEPIRIRTRARGVLAREIGNGFAGFGPGAIHLTGRRGRGGTIRLGEIGVLEDSAGAETPREALLAAADRVPVHATVRIRTRLDATDRRAERRVDLLDGSVESLELGGPRRVFRTTLLAVGVLGDAFLLFAASDGAGLNGGAAGCSGASTYSAADVVPDRLWRSPPAPDALAAGE